MKFTKRIITFFCAFVIVLSSFSIPAYADSKAVGMTFWDFLTYLIDKGDSGASAFGGGAGRSAAAYNSYVSTVQDTLGTSTVGDNCIYLGNWSLDTSLTNAYFVSAGSFTSGSTFSWTCGYDKLSNWTGSLFVVSSFVAPVSGTYSFTPYATFAYSGSGDSTFSFDKLTIFYGDKILSHFYNLGQSGAVNLSAGVTYTVCMAYQSVDSTPRTWNIQGACRVEYPTGALADVAASGHIDITDNTRAGKFSGDYFYEGNGGQQIVADNVTLFNETINNVYNPATKETVPVQSWYYDYSDRSYHYVTDTGNSGIVKYGDENASVTMQNSNGNTVTYNYYYYAKDGSGGGDTPDTPDDHGNNTFKDLLVKFFSAIGDVLAGLIDGLLSLFTKVVGALGKLVDIFKVITQKILDLFGGFTDFLKGVFPFLPDEFFVILNLGALLMVAAAVFRKVFK